MKSLKKKNRLHSYLLNATACKSYRPFDSYTKDELIKVFIDTVNKDLEDLKKL